jgi:hypothetical protein
LSDDLVKRFADLTEKRDDTEAAARIEALEAALQWQPIETAPHGEIVLLGWFEDRDWQTVVGHASWGWRTAQVSNVSRHSHATHWMPLPSPLPHSGSPSYD